MGMFSFTLIAWGFTCKLVKGCPVILCLEHVRAGGGGGSVTIRPFICLYLWVIMSRVYGLYLWSAVAGCGLSGQPRVIPNSRHDGGGPSGDTWGGSQFVSGAQRGRYCL